MGYHELMDDVHNALVENGYKCEDDNRGAVQCYDVARYLIECGWRHPENEEATE